MKRESQKYLCIGLGVLAAFVLWTVAVITVDVRAIGPLDSSVGFAEINGFVHSLTGSNMFLYELTDLLSIVPLGIVAGFGIKGFLELIKRKSLKKVDPDILVLGGFYLLVMGIFLLFEMVVINYRPVLIDGVPEASYPSSTTMLVLCVMPTAVMNIKAYIKCRTQRIILSASMNVFTAFMVAARLISGVHWFSDIVGGILISLALLFIYKALSLRFIGQKSLDRILLQ